MTAPEYRIILTLCKQLTCLHVLKKWDTVAIFNFNLVPYCHIQAGLTYIITRTWILDMIKSSVFISLQYQTLKLTFSGKTILTQLNVPWLFENSSDIGYDSRNFFYYFG